MVFRSLVTPGSGAFDRYGRLTLVAVVAAGIIAAVSMSHAPATAPENLAVALLGGLFLAVLLVGGERLENLGAVARLGYFGLQLALAAAIFACQARLGSFGMAWIILLPLLVQGMPVLSRPGMAALVGAVVLLPVIHVLLLAGPSAALRVGVGVGAGVLFVLLFSAATLRERAARSRSEALAADLAEANRRLAELYVSADEVAATRERNRLAREIHDTLGHTLTVINVQLESVKVLVPSSPDEALRRVDRAARLAREGLAEVRRSVGALRAGLIEERSLDEALVALCRQEGSEGVETGLEVVGESRPLSPERAEALFRTAQEGLTNVHRHAAARRVRLTLDYRRSDRVVLRLADDGRGTESLEGGFGLVGIRERIELLGGRVDVETSPGEGLALTAEIPG
jgi:signal transduction histidine kinase